MPPTPFVAEKRGARAIVGARGRASRAEDVVSRRVSWFIDGMLPWILLTVVALAAALEAERRGIRPLLWVAKPLASIGFVGAAVAAGALTSQFGSAVFIALVWCLMGDVLLIPRDNSVAFLFGLVAFLIGHVGFAIAFYVRGVDTTAVVVTVLALALPAFMVWRWLAPSVPRGMRVPVIVYITVITVMVGFAVGSMALAPAALPLAGALMFYASDLTVARERFVQKSLWNRVVGLPLYYAAQLCFAAATLSTAAAIR